MDVDHHRQSGIDVSFRQLGGEHSQVEAVLTAQHGTSGQGLGHLWVLRPELIDHGVILASDARARLGTNMIPPSSDVGEVAGIISILTIIQRGSRLGWGKSVLSLSGGSIGNVEEVMDISACELRCFGGSLKLAHPRHCHTGAS